MALLNRNSWVAGLLGLSGLSLCVLVPGGPIETRSFAHINPFVLGAFNTFLTTLVLGSLFLVYFVWKSERWALVLAAIFGLSFIGVYGLDLVRIFPVSPDAMPPALLVIELLGIVLGLPLMLLSLQALQKGKPLATTSLSISGSQTLSSAPQKIGAISIGLLAIGIITFATRSAMGL